MFERIDKEEDGEVYVREVVEFLQALSDNLDQSNEVLDQSVVFWLLNKMSSKNAV